MTYIEKIAYHLGKRDEIPNQELAKTLAEEKNHIGIKEIASYLEDKNKSIQSDCLKVLYQIGYISPNLISEYANVFINLLDSKNNRMVWGSMIAIATIAEEVPGEIFLHVEKINELIETGSVITNVWGVKTLINLAMSDQKYYHLLKDDLLRLQKECRTIDFAKRAEDMWGVIQPKEIITYKTILENRQASLSIAAQKRLTRVINKLNI